MGVLTIGVNLTRTYTIPKDRKIAFSNFTCSSNSPLLHLCPCENFPFLYTYSLFVEISIPWVLSWNFITFLFSSCNFLEFFVGEFLFYLQVFFFIIMHIVKVYSFQLRIGYVILTQLKGFTNCIYSYFFYWRYVLKDVFHFSLLLEHFHFSIGLFSIFNVSQLINNFYVVIF